MTEHSCTKHEPGMPACYRHGCRCEPCSQAANRQKKRSACGLTKFVDAAPVRAHIQALLDVGWTYNGIGVSSGVPTGLVEYIATTARRTRPHVAKAILSATLDRGTVNSSGTHRRIQALAALGWPSGVQSRHLGLRSNSIGQVLRRRSVTAATAAAVARMYDELCLTFGPSETSRRRALAAGWAPPLAWDDGYGPHGIDNPAATPYAVSRTRKADQVAARIEDVRELLDGGESAPVIAARVGMSVGALSRWLYRHAPELAAEFARWDALGRTSHDARLTQSRKAS